MRRVEREMEERRLLLGRWVEIPVNELMIPDDGKRVIADAWWVVNRSRNVYFYIGEGYATPHCHKNRRVAETLIANDTEQIIKVRFAFVGNYEITTLFNPQKGNLFPIYSGDVPYRFPCPPRKKEG